MDYRLVSVFSIWSVPAGGCIWLTNTVELPVTRSGTCVFTFECNECGTVIESDRRNNQLRISIDIHVLTQDLAPIAMPLPGPITGPPKPWVTLVWGGTNGGVTTLSNTNVWQDAVYLSRNPTLDSAVRLTSHGERGPLLPGGTYWRSNTVNLPITESGLYYFLFQSNTNGSLVESVTTNNLVAVPFTFSAQLPDLAPILLRAPRVVSGPASQLVYITYAVTNQGVGPAYCPDSWSDVYWSPWFDVCYLSTTPELDQNAKHVSVSYESGPVPAGQVYWRTLEVAFDVRDRGPHFLILKVNDPDYYYGYYGNDNLLESSRTNNTLCVPVDLNVEASDLEPIALVAPKEVESSVYPTVTVAWGVTNHGPAAVAFQDPDYPRRDELYLTTGPSVDWPRLSLGSWPGVMPLPAGAAYWQTNTFQMPVTNPGTYYLILNTSSGSTRYDDNPTNNRLAVPITFKPSPRPDLVPTQFQAPKVWTGSPHPSVPVVWAITNQGAGIVWSNAAWKDALYLSPDRFLSATAIPISTVSESAPTGVERYSYCRTNCLQMPVTVSGDYFLLFRTDDGNQIPEADETNNFVAAPIHFDLSQSDLAASALQVLDAVPTDPYTRFRVAWAVTNCGLGAAFGESSPWRESLYVSQSPGRDGTEVLIASSLHTNTVAAGETYWQTNLVQLSLAQSGDYYLILSVDSEKRLAETNTANNDCSTLLPLKLSAPDLRPMLWLVPNVVTGSLYSSFTVILAVTNQGTVAAVGGSNWVDRIYLSSDPVIPSNGWPMAENLRTNTLPPGAVYWATNSVFLSMAGSGAYYLFASVDDQGAVPDSDRWNNLAMALVNVELLPPVDVALLSLNAPAVVSGSTNPTITLTWQIANAGFSPMLDGVCAWLWLDERPNLPWQTRDIIDYCWCDPTPLEVGASRWQTDTFTLPGLPNGDYYLTMSVTAGNVWGLDANPNDDSLSVPIHFNLTTPLQPVIGTGFFLPDGGFAVEVYGAENTTYVLQASTDLNTWHDVTQFLCFGAPTMVKDPDGGKTGQQFYRVTLPTQNRNRK